MIDARVQLPQYWVLWEDGEGKGARQACRVSSGSTVRKVEQSSQPLADFYVASRVRKIWLQRVFTADHLRQEKAPSQA